MKKAVKIFFVGLNLFGVVFFLGAITEKWAGNFFPYLFGGETDVSHYLFVGALSLWMLLAGAIQGVDMLTGDWGMFSSDHDLGLDKLQKIFFGSVCVVANFALGLIFLFETRSLLGYDIWGNIKVNIIILGVAGLLIANGLYSRRFLKRIK